MNSKAEKLYNKPIVQEDLSFDSPFYAELLFTISEELKGYEDTVYGDKPDEIREIEKEVSFGAFGKYSLTEVQQKLYNDYNTARIEKDPVFRMKAYADDFIDAIVYLQTVLARQFEKLTGQQNGEELIDAIVKKKPVKDESDPILLLVTRTNSLREFVEEYLNHIQNLSRLNRAGTAFMNDCREKGDVFDHGNELMKLYYKQFEFAQVFYKKNNLDQNTRISPDVILKEVVSNQEFIKNNQGSLNKLVKPQYVALEHSKLVSFTRKIMDAGKGVSLTVDKKGTAIEASISTDEDHTGVRIDAFDTLVEEAIGCLLDINAKTFDKNGYIDVPLSAIAQQVLILNPNAHISKEQGNSITESMNKLRHVFVKVDFRAQAAAHKKLNLDVAKASLEDNALNYTKTTVNYKGNTIEVYRIHSYPPRYQYSKSIKQISGVSRNLIYLPNMNITKGVAVLRRYLIEYIEGIRNFNMSETIFFDTVYEKSESGFAYDSKETKRDFRNKVTGILEGFKGNNYIQSYEVVKEGRLLKGVKISLGEAK